MFYWTHAYTRHFVDIESNSEAIIVFFVCPQLIQASSTLVQQQQKHFKDHMIFAVGNFNCCQKFLRCLSGRLGWFTNLFTFIRNPPECLWNQPTPIRCLWENEFSASEMLNGSADTYTLCCTILIRTFSRMLGRFSKIMVINRAQFKCNAQQLAELFSWFAFDYFLN